MRNITLLTGALFLALSGFAQKTSKRSPDMIVPNSLKKQMADMVFIEGGVFTKGRRPQIIVAGQLEHSVLYTPDVQRIIVGSYYLSDHEVTNQEYREFVGSVINSVGFHNVVNAEGKLDVTKIIYEGVPVYPDTACWVNDNPYVYNEPMKLMYYNHSAYADYPVVGINYLQAEAYCKWKTQQMLNLLTDEEKKVFSFTCYLPTDAEWEYAAVGVMEKGKVGVGGHYIYPWWSHGLIDENGKYFANFGQVKDQGGFSVKELIDDGGFHTTKIRQYKASLLGLYDMGGNVAEWTSGKANAKGWNRFLDDTGIEEEDTYESALVKLNAYLDSQRSNSVNDKDSAGYENMAKMLLHDAKLLATGDSRILKGGSWLDGPLYLLVGINEVAPDTKSSSRIGFRVAMKIATR